MEKDDEEIKIYDEVYSYMYLTASCYPEGVTKADKATSKKRQKKFEVRGGWCTSLQREEREVNEPQTRKFHESAKL